MEHTEKTQDIFTQYHIKVILYAVAFCILATVALYAAGFIPATTDAKQSAECEGAQHALASLQEPPGNESIAQSKIDDARDLVDRECGKAA